MQTPIDIQAEPRYALSDQAKMIYTFGMLELVTGTTKWFGHCNVCESDLSHNDYRRVLTFVTEHVTTHYEGVI